MDLYTVKYITYILRCDTCGEIYNSITNKGEHNCPTCQALIDAETKNKGNTLNNSEVFIG